MFDGALANADVVAISDRQRVVWYGFERLSLVVHFLTLRVVGDGSATDEELAGIVNESDTLLLRFFRF